MRPQNHLDSRKHVMVATQPILPYSQRSTLNEMDRYTEAFERMVDLRVKDSSKRNYKAKINRIKIFLLEKYPEMLDNQRSHTSNA